MKAAAMLGVAVLFSVSAAAHAQVVHFQNPGQFYWQGELPFPPQPGMTLDVTQPPSQTNSPSTRTLWYQPSFHTSSGSITAYNISSESFYNVGASQARVARRPDSVMIREQNGAYYPFDNVAAIFHSGDSIGPTHTWNVKAAVYIGSFAGGNQIAFGHGFIGVEFSMPDGLHYGYIELGSETRKPLSWGYESQPNTAVVIPQVCGTSDFNGDGDFGTDADIEAFFACLGGSCCSTCYPDGSDFNNDGDSGTDADIEAFFRVLSGNACP